MYKIGEIAKLADVTPDTVRYYEKQNLLSASQRSASGYRLYSDEDVTRLRFIRYAKTMGFTLEEIAELLSIRIEPGKHTCQESKAIVESRLAEVELRLAELKKIRYSLQKLSDACCGSAHTSVSCSILEALEYGATR
jgi:MerR family Zn(II)-responsive transcriptional regulator of zntA